MDTYAGWFAYLMKKDLMFVKRFPTYPDRVYNEVAGLYCWRRTAIEFIKRLLQFKFSSTLKIWQQRLGAQGETPRCTETGDRPS